MTQRFVGLPLSGGLSFLRAEHVTAVTPFHAQKDRCSLRILGDPQDAWYEVLMPATSVLAILEAALDGFEPAPTNKLP